jgi:hypothetical protein
MTCFNLLERHFPWVLADVICSYVRQISVKNLLMVSFQALEPFSRRPSRNGFRNCWCCGEISTSFLLMVIWKYTVIGFICSDCDPTITAVMETYRHCFHLYDEEVLVYNGIFHATTRNLWTWSTKFSRRKRRRLNPRRRMAFRALCRGSFVV